MPQPARDRRRPRDQRRDRRVGAATAAAQVYRGARRGLAGRSSGSSANARRCGARAAASTPSLRASHRRGESGARAAGRENGARRWSTSERGRPRPSLRRLGARRFYWARSDERHRTEPSRRGARGALRLSVNADENTIERVAPCVPTRALPESARAARSRAWVSFAGARQPSPLPDNWSTARAAVARGHSAAPRVTRRAARAEPWQRERRRTQRNPPRQRYSARSEQVGDCTRCGARSGPSSPSGGPRASAGACAGAWTTCRSPRSRASRRAPHPVGSRRSRP